MGIIVSFISLIIIIGIAIYILTIQRNLEQDLTSKLRELINKINNASYYTYNFDMEQNKNISNTDKNVSTLYNSVVSLQNNVKVLEDIALTSSDISENVLTQQANVGKIKLGDKWLLSGVGDGQYNDSWLRFLDKKGQNYYGGIASGDLWVGNNSYLNQVHMNQLCIGQTCINESDLIQYKNNNNNLTNILKPGLSFIVYSGYFNDNTNFFKTASEIGRGSSVDGTNLTTITNGVMNVNQGQLFSIEFTGYFIPKESGFHTFAIASDDAAYFWIGPNALEGYNVTNASINLAGLHGTNENKNSINLTSGQYYPVRIQYGQNQGGCDCQFWFSTPSKTKTYNLNGYIFSY
jgi:hypothetical protein